MKKNLAVGYFFNAPFPETVSPHLARVAETFFAWPGVLSCRPAPVFTDEVRARFLDDLRWAKTHGIALDTLFNANCYGEDAVSTRLADSVMRVLDEMAAAGIPPDVVTTTSPFVARVFRKRAPGVRIRASINMRIHGTVGFEAVGDLFDEFYLSRERHRDLAYVRRVAEWAKANGKRIGMQLNSGCLRQCPFQTFHDNLHGHGDGRRPEDVAAGKEYDFSFFLCRTRYARDKAFGDFLRATWIRPEDAHLFEPFVDFFKLAIRRHPRPEAVLRAYATESFDGNLLTLMDPDHSAAFAPDGIDNKAFPADWAESGIAANCANDCRHCGKCDAVLSRVLHPVRGEEGAPRPMHAPASAE